MNAYCQLPRWEQSFVKLKLKSSICFHENTSEHVFCKMAAISSRSPWVNSIPTHNTLALIQDKSLIGPQLPGRDFWFHQCYCVEPVVKLELWSACSFLNKSDRKVSNWKQNFTEKTEQKQNIKQWFDKFAMVYSIIMFMTKGLFRWKE